MERIYQYTVNFIPAEEGGYVVEVPALPGCHTQGENLREAEYNAREAIALYLETLIEAGEPLPKDIIPVQKQIELKVA